MQDNAFPRGRMHMIVSWVTMVDAEGIELEPLCGRPRPQAAKDHQAGFVLGSGWWTRKESNPLDNGILTTYNAADGTERSLFDVIQRQQHGYWHGSTATLKPAIRGSGSATLGKHEPTSRYKSGR
jgi:hypothetical protein